MVQTVAEGFLGRCGWSQVKTWGFCFIMSHFQANEEQKKKKKKKEKNKNLALRHQHLATSSLFKTLN